eukprot:m.125740 g.125740  ORF g.125740 m.125740 type:complete len:74 (+) comp22151_c0_seq2:1571-1792(+)
MIQCRVRYPTLFTTAPTTHQSSEPQFTRPSTQVRVRAQSICNAETAGAVHTAHKFVIEICVTCVEEKQTCIRG